MIHTAEGPENVQRGQGGLQRQPGPGACTLTLEIKMESQINSLEARIEKMQERFNKDLEEIKIQTSQEALLPLGHSMGSKRYLSRLGRTAESFASPRDEAFFYFF